MHTNEITHDEFIPRWYGRLGNNIQQISNGIFYCRENGIHFTSPEQPMIKRIDIFFGDNQYKIPTGSNNWFYHFEPEYSDFTTNIEKLNRDRKYICENYILKNIKVNQNNLNDPLPYQNCVAHIRAGDVYSHSTHPAYAQNPFMFYMEVYRQFNGNVIFVSEDATNPIAYALKQHGINVNVLSLEQTYELLLRAQNIATSGVGTFAISAAFCSKNIKRLYCTNLYLKNTLNPEMLKEHLEVNMMDIDGNKYIRVGEWRYTQESVDKVINYSEDISFRRL